MAAAVTLKQPSIYAYEGELKRFFRSRESELGIGSTFGAMVSVAIGGGGGESHDHDGRMVHLVDRAKTLSVFRIVWRALRAMDEAGQSRHVVALHLLYGHTREPDFPPGAFGDVARLVHLTDAAEEAREDAAADEGETAHARYEETVAPGWEAERDTAIAEEFWRTARKVETLLRLSDRARDPQKSASAFDEARAYWNALAALLRSYADVPTVANDMRMRASLSACVSADERWTTKAAIKHKLEYHGPRHDPEHPGELGKPVKAAHEAWTFERAEWSVKARTQAEQLRTDALEAYRAARQGASK